MTLLSKRGILVLVAIYLQSVISYSSCVVTSGFYVNYMQHRGVNSFLIGLYGMMPGIGFLLNLMWDLTTYFLKRRGMPLYQFQLAGISVLVLQCMAQSVAVLIPVEYNWAMIVILQTCRFIQGYIGFIVMKAIVIGCRCWFPDYEWFTIGLTNSGYYVGGGVSILLGGIIYDQYGFAAPMLILGAVNLVLSGFEFAVLPRDNKAVCTDETKNMCTVYSNPQADQKNSQENDLKKNSEVTDSTSSSSSNVSSTSKNKISPLVALPIIAFLLLELLVGYCSSLTTPYLHEVFNVSIGKGSSYLFILFFGLMIGSALSGSLLQKGSVSPTLIMAVGAVMAGVAVIIMFPNVSLTFLYKHVVVLAYFSTFFLGLSTQMTTVAALVAIEHVHVRVAGRRLTEEVKSLITTLWLFFWITFSRFGHMVALFVMELMSYEQGSWLMLVLVGISCSASVTAELLLRKKRYKDADMESESSV